MNQQRTPHVTPHYSQRTGLWHARSRKYGRDVTGYGKTKRDALDDFARKWSEFDTERGELARYRTVGEWWTYLETLDLPGSERTRRWRESTIRNYVLPKLGQVPLDSVTVADGEKLKKWLVDNHAKNTAIHGVKAARWLLNQAVRLERLDKNRLDFVTLPTDDTTKRFLDVDEQQRLVAASRGDRLEVVVLSLLNLGLRSGELSGLQWQDLDFRKRTVEVRRQLTGVLEAENKVKTAPPKYKSTRTLPFTDSLAGLLQQHRERQRDEAKGWRPGQWDGADFVVLNSRGTPVGKDRMCEHVRRIADTARLNDHSDRPVNCQVLRRTCATRLHDSGVPLLLVSRWLGHKDLKTTQTYLQVNDERLGEVRDVVEKWGL
jgi:integrase